MIAAIIQARMGSSRLPNKILLKAAGKSFLEHMIDRVKRSQTLNKIVIATTTEEKDEVLAEFCKERGIECHRGSEKDVLSRYKLVSDSIGAKVIVRLTADTPTIDPRTIDKVVSIHKNNRYDFVCNNFPLPRTYPDGMNVEVFSKNILDEMYKKSRLPSEREHVTFYVLGRPEKYKIFRVDYKKDLSKYRLNLDYPEDYFLLKTLFESLYIKNRNFTLEDVIYWLDTHPKIFEVNSQIKSNQGIFDSFEQEKMKRVKNKYYKKFM